MRRTLVIAAVVLALSIALCAVSAALVGRVIGGAESLRLSAMRAAEAGDLARARALAGQLLSDWQADEKTMELITAHDALGEVEASLQDALICLDAGNAVEFLRAASEAGAALHRIRVAEAVRLMNLF